MNGQAPQSLDLFFPATPNRCESTIHIDNSSWVEVGSVGSCRGDTLVLSTFSDVSCDGAPVNMLEYAPTCSETAFGNQFRTTVGCGNPTLFCSGLENRELTDASAAAAVHIGQSIAAFALFLGLFL